MEGGDGAGKGSVIAHLDQALRDAGHDVLLTREPGGTPEGLALRALLLADAGKVWDPHAELLLMMAARVQHVRSLIEPALRDGRLVLCDRFFASTLAYQGGGRGLDAKIIKSLHKTMVGEVLPDLTLLLDVDPAIGLSRSHARLHADPGLDEGRFESLDLSFHRRVRAAYLAQAQEAPDWAVIDGAQELSAVQTEAARIVLSRVADFQWPAIRDRTTSTRPTTPTDPATPASTSAAPTITSPDDQPSST